MNKLFQTNIVAVLVLLLLAPGLAGSHTGASLRAALEQPDATCSDGYALWADSQDGSATLDWSGSDTYVTGNVHSNRDISLGGSTNVITGVTRYVTDFADGGDDNQYSPPVQVSPDAIPVSYDISAYQPGGAAATVADQEGRYHYIDGDFEVSDGNVRLDGLYYVTGEVTLSGSDLYGTVTIVAREQIELSGSDHSFEPYSNGLLLFTDWSSFDDSAILISGSASSLQGMIYAPLGQIELSGSVNTFAGGLFGYRLKLNGSTLMIQFDEVYCPEELPPLSPDLTINYASGGPGSVFTLWATDFAPGQTAEISVNGLVLGTVDTGADGTFTLLLATGGADEGRYFVALQVNGVTTRAQFEVAVGEAVYLAEEEGPLFTVPAGYAFTTTVHLPAVMR